MERTLGELAALVGGRLEGDPARRISGVAAVDEAGPAEITFLSNPKYATKVKDSKAGAIVIDAKAAKPAMDAIRVADPNFAFIAIAEAFAEKYPAPQGIHPTAVVAPSAKLAPGVAVGPHAIIGDGAEIGPGSVIHALVFVGPKVRIGKDVLLHPHVTIREGCRLGDRVILGPGTVIGSDGFGFATKGTVHHKIPQFGIVEIGDDVELGANCTVDRARFGRTVIGHGCKLDNLVHLAHNVTLGEGVLIAAGTVIAGSSRIGRFAMLGGQVAVGGHVTVGERAILTGQAGLSKDMPAGQMYNGTPAMPHIKHLRAMAAANRVAGLLEEIRDLRRRLKAVEEGLGRP